MNDTHFDQGRTLSRRAAFGLAAGAAGLALGARPAFAAEKIRIALATKTWWPSVIAEVAAKEGLFTRAGVDAELTVYRSGGEAFEALAAGATDMITGLVPQMATGRRRGVNTKIVALAADANTGWKLLVRTNSPIRSMADVAGKKVGITAAGSLSDFMALWSRTNYKIDFTSVPLGGGGLVPNLLSGNVDAAIVYSPLSFQMLQRGQAREIEDFAKTIPPHLAVGWATTDAIIDGRKDLLRASLRALYGAVAHMRSNRDAAIATIAEVNGIPATVAAQEYEETFLKLSTDGRFTLDQTRVALDLARIGGFQNLASAEEIVTMEFTPVSLAA
jgi:NitT/TauT family transport system substrate-binding protein